MSKFNHFCTPVLLLGLMKGIFSLVKWGLTSCEEGFGNFNGRCIEGPRGDGRYDSSTGHLHFQPKTNSEDMVDELGEARRYNCIILVVSLFGVRRAPHTLFSACDKDLLLTGERLNSDSKSMIRSVLSDRHHIPRVAEKNLQIAQQLLVAAPEFHFSGENVPI